MHIMHEGRADMQVENGGEGLFLCGVHDGQAEMLAAWRGKTRVEEEEGVGRVGDEGMGEEFEREGEGGACEVHGGCGV